VPATRSEPTLQSRLIERAWRDDRFLTALRDDPATALRQGLGVELAPGVSVRLVEQDEDELVLVLPTAPGDTSLTAAAPADVTPFAGTNISANSGCHQCCKP
jgi:hypothetical protein